MRSQVRDTRFYYDLDLAAASLERVWPDSDTDNEDYSADRLYSRGTLYHQSKSMGFLNLIPRAGVTFTHYSKTRETQTSVETNTVWATNTTVSVSGETNTVVSSSYETNNLSTTVEGSGKLRNSLELGLEASFKAFKTWGFEDPRRHVVEPYANYTFVPEPSVLPESLYQFDSIDQLNEIHQVQIGLRNKLQGKRKRKLTDRIDADEEDVAEITSRFGTTVNDRRVEKEEGEVIGAGESAPFDIIDADVYTIVNLDTEEDEDAIDSLYFDAELTPGRSFAIDFDGRYSVSDSQIATFNSRMTFYGTEIWALGLEHRFTRDESSLFSANLTVSPTINWTFNTYGRYEFELSRIEEYGGYIQRNYDCMVVRFGANLLPGYERSDGTERDDELRFLLELWLTAFPEYSLSGRHKR